MNLRGTQFKEDYRSGQDNILDDFFRPCLSSAKVYWRAVGYFCSSAFEAFGTPLDDFVKRGGSIRLITSVQLTEDDYGAIQSGLSKRQACEERVAQIIDEEFSGEAGNGARRLAALLEMDRLQIQIAVPKRGRGIYHEKVGVFFDDSDFVAFSGSTNESWSAMEENYECTDVYPSWDSPKRAQRKLNHFNDLWVNNDKGAEVFPFPEAAKRSLIKLCQRGQADRHSTTDNEEKQNPEDKQLSEKWRHQDQALNVFLAHERGVLNMATGTGKTRVALQIIEKLFEKDIIDTVIISTDGTDLLDQWYGEILAFRRRIDRNIVIFRHYYSYRGVDDYTLDPRGATLLVSRMQLPRALIGLESTIAKRMLLVHDEVHGLGSTGNRAHLGKLSDNIRFRLGLSATPEREYDQEGNDFIEEHIGPVIFEFDLKEAIKRGILSEFAYYPLPYDLTDEDKRRVAAVYARREAHEKEGNPMSDEELAMAIARVYKTSPAKLPVFDKFISENQQLLGRCIVFVETMEYGEEVLSIIHRYRPDFHTYFMGEDSSTLRSFARGELECLVTCHRLSQGIDIQSLNTVIMFSSSRGRLETIQRMGRCLRINPSDPDKRANVVDFIRNNDSSDEPNADELRRDWLIDLSLTKREE